MQQLASKLLIIHNACNAGCNHCPFGDSTEPTTIFSVHSIIREVENSPQPLLVISGGEPLLYPHLKALLDKLQYVSDKIIRIATGGHIDITPFLAGLNFPTFSGISLGTDIWMPERNLNIHLRVSWLKNIVVLNQEKIPYSLTFTLDPQIDVAQLLAQFDAKVVMPDFIMINELESAKDVGLSEKIEQISQHFHQTRITYGFRN